ncbi:MAG: hypothetical protein M3R38_33110 [Actinomycetota bacterium]|nr:hypothetical protein [Actinomycetota bacterium]
MTIKTRQMVRDLDPTNELERGLPCVVRHEDAGGRCQKAATVRMYDVLNFCPEHGEEARIGALLELYQDAGYFFDRFRNPHVPDMNPLIERELAAAIRRMNDEGPSDEDYYRALSRAYPNPPEKVREIIRQWERDEKADQGPMPADLLLDSLNTLNKLMRLAHADGECWLVEILEHERQETAARAACALEESDRPGSAA